MAAIKETTRARLMMLHALAMLVLGMLLFYVRDTMQFFYAFGCALAMLLIAASLIFVAALDWICVLGHGPEQAHRLRGFLLASVGAAMCGVALALYPGATIRMFCYVLAVYTLLLGCGKYQLARNLILPERIQKGMIVVAAVVFLLGVFLLVVAGWDERMVITLMGFYSLFMGAEMLLSMFYLHEVLEPERPSTGSEIR
jgi:hypothetical protein